MPLGSRTRATLRSAEFGFFGVVVYTRVHTPRRWGEPFSAGVLVFSTLSSRPLRTSWLIVGMGGLDLLPALGRALDVVLAVIAVVHGAGPFWPPATIRPPRSGVSPFPGPGRCSSDRNRSPLATRRRHLPAEGQELDPGDPEASTSGHPGAPRTGAGPGTLGTGDHSTRAWEAGQSRVPHMHGHRPSVAHRGGRHTGQRCACGFDSLPAHR